MKFNTKEERDKFILDNLELVDYAIKDKVKYRDYIDYKSDIRVIETKHNARKKLDDSNLYHLLYDNDFSSGTN